MLGSTQLLFFLCLLPVKEGPRPIKKEEIKMYALTVIIPKGIARESISIWVDNGKNESQVKLKGNTLHISGVLYSRYATILITQGNQNTKSFYSSRFWFKNKAGTIHYLNDSKKRWVNNPIINLINTRISLRNVLSANMMGEKLYLKSIENEQEIKQVFERTNSQLLSNNDSITIHNYMHTVISLDNARLKFVRTHKNLYYSFWLFKTSLIYTGSGYIQNYLGAQPSDLIAFFEDNFDKALKLSYEGKIVTALLRAKNLRLNIPAPLFSLSQTNGRTLDLKEFKGKDVLLIFWASWCIPCLAEIPALIKIQSNYNNTKIKMISVSLDKDSVAYNTALKKYGITWSSTFANKSIVKDYGITGIPEIFLINKEGMLIYKREQESNVEELPVLNAVITKSILNDYVN